MLFLENPSILGSNLVVLSRGQFCLSGDIWQCPEIILIVTAGREGGELPLTPSGKKPGMVHIIGHRKAPHSKELSSPECQ